MNTNVKKKPVVVIENMQCHHLPQDADVPDIRGDTLRQALQALRGVNWGNLGGTHGIGLSDGTWLLVCNQGCRDGSSLMSSQIIHRMEWRGSDARSVRTYRIE
jgi:hypothetical protein